MNYNEILDNLVNSIDKIPNDKKYWLIRTQSGSLYEVFVENNFVGLGHTEVSLKSLSSIRNTFTEANKRLSNIKDLVTEFYTEDEECTITKQQVGLIAGQISNFYEEVKKGDIVIIPSSNSEFVSFGIVQESSIAEFSDEEKRNFEYENQFLNKRVEWIQDFPKKSLDPNLFKMFTSHQAITNVSKYADVIERSLQDFFILGEEAHFIINVQSRHDIKAKDLFSLGYNLLELIDEIAEHLNLSGISSNDFEVKINLNSPGKIDLKSSIKKSTLFAGIVLAIVGGGYTSSNGSSLKTEGLIKAISDFLDKQDNRNMKKEVFNQYKDSLNIKNPDDMIKILKQFDTNKDIPK